MYNDLVPSSSLLTDVVVLSQAWKKSHAHIRRHNWYADTLELDVSAVDVERHLESWAAQLRGDAYATNPIRLVLAPKNSRWTFDRTGRWVPLEVGQLRPLAHLGIQEQTVATAIMLCLANCIETAQGPSDLESVEAKDLGVCSYGNRLYCSWTSAGSARPSARFSWGSSDSFSRYFRDYQRFIERPREIARRARAESPGERIYLVKLDLTSFYDCIDIEMLVSKLKAEWLGSRAHQNESSHVFADARPDEKFWELARRSLTFDWHVEDVAAQVLLRGMLLPSGLPQGMVASGFFANAYLLDFDRLMMKRFAGFEHVREEATFRIHDYCRYVDDMRLVISSRGEASERTLTRIVSNCVQELLDKACKGARHNLRLNPEKTEFESYSEIGGESATAAKMRSLQQQISGPFDVGSLLQTEAGLEGLLIQAERSWKNLEESEFQSNTLAALSRSVLDVRDDTLTRFAAYRWAKVLRLRRRFVSGASVNAASAVNAVPIALLRQDFELVARRLVGAWALNPSLVQVLRFGLDLCAATALLDPVLVALRDALGRGYGSYERQVALYVSAEVLRAAATETGRRNERDAELQLGNLETFRSSLARFAKELLADERAPWFVLQQASLFLLTSGEASSEVPPLIETRSYRALHLYMLGQMPEGDFCVRELVAISIVGYQIQRDINRYSAWLILLSKRFGPQAASMALELIGHVHPGVLELLLRSPLILAERFVLPPYLHVFARGTGVRESRLLPDRWYLFAEVISHRDSVFVQENALVALGRAISLLVRNRRDLDQPEHYTPWTIELLCSDWSRTGDPRGFPISARLVSSSGGDDPRYATPVWCKGEGVWTYAIGRLLRAAATGEADFTARQWLLREDVGWYQGVRSSWFQRRVGMYHAHSALRGTQAAFTPWFTELLLNLLKWPGIRSVGAAYPELGALMSISDLICAFEERIAFQAELYGRSSDVPVYIYPVDWDVRAGGTLRVGIVQGLMPALDDFKGGLAALAAPNYRSKHRAHLATLLSLAQKTLIAREGVIGERSHPKIDLVILPEYCVHVDDQDLVRAFSDATGSMTFYGLLGATHPVTGEPVNAARWLVPQRRSDRRSWIEIDQGKMHPTSDETALGVSSWRPFQVVIELRSRGRSAFRVSGAVCYDATDLSLAADLKNVSHMFVVAALNRDVRTFDSMVGALRYHMYQHVIVANTGEFGGSTAQAPYDVEHMRLVTHAHGPGQLSVSVFDLHVDHFGPSLLATAVGAPAESRGKTPPANLKRM